MEMEQVLNKAKEDYKYITEIYSLVYSADVITEARNHHRLDILKTIKGSGEGEFKAQCWDYNYLNGETILTRNMLLPDVSSTTPQHVLHRAVKWLAEGVID